MSIGTTQRERLMSQPNGNANGFGNGRHQGRNRTRGGPALWVWVVGGVLLLAAGTAAAFYVIRTQSTGTAGAGLTFEVAQGPIVVSVTESGTIKAAEQEIIKSEIEGQATLIYLIPEGTRVQKGDLLAELDVTGMNDERIEDEIAV